VVGQYVIRPAAPKPPVPQPAPTAPPSPVRVIEPVYEIRIYTAAPGKLEALNARMRDFMIPILAKYQIETVKYGQLKDRPNVLVHMVRHADPAAREANWARFREDAEWKRAIAASELKGALVENLESQVVSAVDFSKLR
jgi:hypothetical protein